MENYINIKKVKDELDFVNLAITTKNIDSKNKEDLLNTFKEDEFNLERYKREFNVVKRKSKLIWTKSNGFIG